MRLALTRGANDNELLLHVTLSDEKGEVELNPSRPRIDD